MGKNSSYGNFTINTPSKLVKNMMEEVLEECDEHNFEFVTCLGTFCTNCNIPFGEECLYPGCKIRDCGTHMLVYNAFEEKNYGDVANEMTTQIAFLHLGHDGVGCNNGPDIEGLEKLLSFKNIRRIEYCGYYSPDYFLDTIKEEKYKDIEFVPIR